MAVSAVGNTHNPADEWLEGFALYPNPNMGTFTVEMTSSAHHGTSQVEFLLFNELGQRLIYETADFSGTSFKYQFAHRELPAAVYTLAIRSGANVKWVKVVVGRE